MQRAIPAMKAKRHGVIVNFSSASTRTRLPMRTAYVVSKVAVEGLTLLTRDAKRYRTYFPKLRLVCP